MLLIYLILICLTCFQQFELKQVVILVRHGARTPIKLLKYKKKVFETKDAGVLTQLGKNQMYALGIMLQQEYQNFISDVYNYEEFQAISSTKLRCYESAIYFIMGFYRQFRKDQIRPTLSPTLDYFERPDYNEISIAITGDQDYLFHTQTESDCPFVNNMLLHLQHYLYDEPIFQKYNEYHKNFRELLHIVEEVNDSWNTKYQINKFYPSDITQIYDLMYCLKFHDLHHKGPQLNQNALDFLKKERKIIRYNISEKNVISKSTFFFEFLYKAFEQKCYNRRNIPKFVYMSGHDSNIFAVLKAILQDKFLEDQDDENLDLLLIEFAGTVKFELFEKNLRQYIRVKLQDQIVPIKNCKNPNMCDLDSFLKLIDQYIIKDIPKKCTDQTNTCKNVFPHPIFFKN